MDIFAGQWSSQLPPPYEALTGGASELFEDERIGWADAQFGGLRGMRVLELGPLEGGHTYMLDRLGAAEVTAIEANRRAFLRCLVVKELLGIPSAHFMCGDFMSFLAEASTGGRQWDLCVALGVLYHQQDPVALLDLMTDVASRLLLWTHYFDVEVLRGRPDLAASFTSSRQATTAGFEHTLHRHEYGPAFETQAFCGGLSRWTSWMTRSDLLAALAHFDFEVVSVAFDEPQHLNGPALCLAARRRQGPRTLGEKRRRAG